MNSNTLFGHVALRFAIHPENLATEALSFILRTSLAASRGFTAFVREIGLDDPGSLRFDTQQGGLEQSIPDMKCCDDKGRLRVIVENKFWAGLTENQPVTYIRELPAEIAAIVLFVVPKARLQLVWTEVVARCTAAVIPVCGVDKSPTMKVADIGGSHHLAVTSWGVLLDVLSRAASSAGETEPLNDIAQLQGLCRQMDEEEFLPLGGDDLTNLGMAKRIINFSDLPFRIVDEAARLGFCTKKKESNFRYGSGTYLRIGQFAAWAGFSANLWRNLGVSPIWVNFYPESCRIAEVREKLSRFRTVSPQRCFDTEIKNYRFVAVPIFLTTGVEKQRIIEDCVRQISELAAELDAPVPAGTPSSPQIADRDPNADSYSVGQGAVLIGETILEVGAEGGSIERG